MGLVILWKSFDLTVLKKERVADFGNEHRYCSWTCPYKYVTAAKGSFSILIAILNMFLFVGTNLLKGNVTGPTYNDQKI